MPTSEREQFIQNWEREFNTTMKVLKSYPTSKANLQPHGKCPTAKDLAWRIVSEENMFVNGALTGKFDFTGFPTSPSTMQDVISAYERNHSENATKLKKMTDLDFNKMVNFMVAPKTPGDVRSGDTLWTLL